MGVFDAFQIPYSALEREHESAIRDAAVAGSGTIIRGGVARGAPSIDDATLASYPDFWRPMVEARRDRWEQADLDDLLDGMTRMEFMLRFTLSHPDMHTTIVGTANLDHLADNVAAAQKGALAPDVYETAKQRLAADRVQPAASSSVRREAHGAVEADHLAVEHRIVDDLLDEHRELVRVSQTLRERLHARRTCRGSAAARSPSPA